jgi:hypothetical protein
MITGLTAMLMPFRTIPHHLPKVVQPFVLFFQGHRPYPVEDTPD